VSLKKKPFHKHEPGIASPWDFRNVKTYPAGTEYLQLDYGLMEDFLLEKGIN
jgi:hypothetical protein